MGVWRMAMLHVAVRRMAVRRVAVRRVAVRRRRRRRVAVRSVAVRRMSVWRMTVARATVGRIGASAADDGAFIITRAIAQEWAGVAAARCVHAVVPAAEEAAASSGGHGVRGATEEGRELDSPSIVHSQLDPTQAMGITANRGLCDICPRLELIELLGGRDHLGDARELSAARFAAGEEVGTDAHKQPDRIQGWAQ